MLIKFASNEISDYDHNNADWQKIEDLLKEENIQKLDILIELTNIFKPNSNEEIAIDCQMSVLYIDLAFEAAYRFYQLAPLRARTIAENTLRHMKELGVTEAAIISGGFLTNQICAVLEREAVSYVAIIPAQRDSMIMRTRKNYMLKMRGDLVEQRSFIDELRERVST